MAYSPKLFLDFCLTYIHSTGGTVGMKAKAAKHFQVDRRTISRWIDSLRSSKSIGRSSFQRWRDSLD